MAVFRLLRCLNGNAQGTAQNFPVVEERQFLVFEERQFLVFEERQFLVFQEGQFLLFEQQNFERLKNREDGSDFDDFLTKSIALSRSSFQNCFAPSI